MLADPKAEALVSNFAGQWLHLRNLKGKVPNSFQFPDFDDDLRRAMLEETELFFRSVMDEDRNVLDLMTADYTFVNERLARHYGIRDVYGSQFRRVTLTDDARRGLLGKGAILMVTSHAHRTSPVLRGKWILENVIGVSPAPPPDDVPGAQGRGASRQAAVRARSARGASRQPGLRQLPSRARSARPGAGELRCRRRLAHTRRRHAWKPRRRLGRAGRRHAGRRRRRAAAGAGARAGDVRPHDDREAADVCGRTRPRAVGHAGGAIDRARLARARTIASRRSCSASSGACRSRCGSRRAKRPTRRTDVQVDAIWRQEL